MSKLSKQGQHLHQITLNRQKNTQLNVIIANRWSNTHSRKKYFSNEIRTHRTKKNCTIAEKDIGLFGEDQAKKIFNNLITNYT
jgi:hypothetical protein